MFQGYSVMSLKQKMAYGEYKKGLRFRTQPLLLFSCNLLIQKLLQMEFQQKLLCGVSMLPYNYPLLSQNL